MWLCASVHIIVPLEIGVFCILSFPCMATNHIALIYIASNIKRTIRVDECRNKLYTCIKFKQVILPISGLRMYNYFQDKITTFIYNIFENVVVVMEMNIPHNLNIYDLTNKHSTSSEQITAGRSASLVTITKD